MPIVTHMFIQLLASSELTRHTVPMDEEGPVDLIDKCRKVLTEQQQQQGACGNEACEDAHCTMKKTKQLAYVISVAL